MNEIATVEKQELTAGEIQAQVTRIQQVMGAVMKSNVHYGVIPGTQKPTLYKPGAEKILMTFQISSEVQVEDLGDDDVARFRVFVTGKNQAGRVLGVGVGECSSDEEKYKWRKMVCQEEFDETFEDRKRIVWKRVQGKPTKVQQIRTNKADLSNTILKMAKKRGLVDMTLNVTAASDVFDQDIEDMPENIRQEVAGNTIQEPQPKAEEPTQETAPESSGGVTVTETRVLKTGENSKGKWELLLVKLSDGSEGTTLDRDMVAYAKQMQESGRKVTAAFEKNGQYTNLTQLVAE